MPKFGAHMIFAEEAATRRPDLFPDLNMNALRFGAIGPDTSLFLFDPLGKAPGVREGFSKVLSILSTIQKIQEEVRDVANMLTKPAEDIADWLSGGLSRDLKYTLNASTEAMLLAAKLGIAFGVGTLNIKNPIFKQIQNLPRDLIDNPALTMQNWTIQSADNFGFPFRMFGHPYTSDGNWKVPEQVGDYSKWWWMDMLHYRKSGTFAAEMLSSAASPVQANYARGYLTHVGGDICGHPFINTLVGGPFRNHAYRHMVLETLADVEIWEDYHKQDVLNAKFHQLIDLPDHEVEEIGDLVVRSMRQVYSEPMLPDLLNERYPTSGEWVFAYRAMSQYLRLSTGGAIPRPTPPPDTPKEVINEIRNLLQNNFPSRFPRWNGNVVDFLKSLFSWFGKGIALLTMIMTLPFAVIMRFVTIAPRWIIYFLNLAVFYIISAIRTMLCITGWGYCSSDDLNSFGFLIPWIRTRVRDDNQYPCETVPVPKPPFYWLMEPDAAVPNRAPVEQPSTYSLAPRRNGLSAIWMIDPANKMDRGAFDALYNAQSSGETIDLERQYIDSLVFGNAVDFSIAMLDKTIPIPDFDLDGDRGFGFKSWDELPPNSYYI